MHSKKVSVALATYNGEKFLYKQLQSILEQLDENGEIIISDNGSTDNTINIIKNFQDERIKLFHNPVKGVIKNFENALNKVTGDIIFLSDQDDIWLSQKIKIAGNYLQQYDLVMSDCLIIDEDENIVHESLYSIKNSGPGIIKNLKANTYTGCCMAFTKKVLKLALPFPANIPMHDIWLGFIGDLFFTSCFIKDKLVMYRRHNQNASFTSGKSTYSIAQKIQFRLQTVRYLPLLLIRKRKL